MKRSTAVGNLTEMAEVVSHLVEYREIVPSPLEEMWVAGDILTPGPAVEHLSVVCMLDTQGEEMPWMSRGGAVPWLEDQLRLGKRPLSWCFRALSDPVWTMDHRRLVRFWTATDGLDESAMRALSDGSVERLDVVEAPTAVLAGQLKRELGVANRRLGEVLDRYWDENWRRSLKKSDESPEEHLWDAAEDVRELQEALDSA